MNTDTQSLSSTFMKAFGDQLTAVYIYDHPPDDKVLLVPTADVDIHQLRAVFLESGSNCPPIIVPQPIFAQYLRLFPLMAEALQDGTCLHGDPIQVERRTNRLPHWAQEAMDASAALSKPEEMGRLQTLARQLLGRDVDDGETAVSLLAAIHRHLNRLLNDIGVPEWTTDIGTTDAVLPGLIAGYRQMGAMVYVFDGSLPDLLAEVDGETLLAAMEQPADGVRLVTARQLRLLLLYESAAAFTLQNYTHVWGADPLADLSPNRKIVFRDAARKAAVFRTSTFIHDYFVMSDDADAIHVLIHDFQNRLLNVQLEHELLYRLLSFERFVQPTLPDRDAPAIERLDAIFEQLDWWSAQYVAKMTASN